MNRFYFTILSLLLLFVQVKNAQTQPANPFDKWKQQEIENYFISTNSLQTVNDFFFGIFQENNTIKNEKELREAVYKEIEILEQSLSVSEDTKDKLNMIREFGETIYADSKLIKSNQSIQVLLQSQTLEKVGEIGIDKLPDILLKTELIYQKISGKSLISNTVLKKFDMGDFGLIDLTKAISRQIGSKKVDIETLTLYLDGVNKMTWGILGYLVAKNEGAKNFQNFGDLLAKELRKRSYSIFEQATLHFQGNKKTIIEQWQTLQNVRVQKGLLALPLNMIYTKDELLSNGFSSIEIINNTNKINDYNNSLINNKNWNIQEYKNLITNEKAKIGGVTIEMSQLKEENIDMRLHKIKIIESKPISDTTLYWDINK